MLLPFFALLIPLFSALRLAKFNVDERQTESFLGLPTPASAIFIASLPFLLQSLYPSHPGMYSLIGHAYTFIAVVAALSFLMISELPLFALKFKSLNVRANAVQYVFVILSVLLLVLFRLSALPLIIVAYVLLSLMVYLFRK
jgi:CDP-diacylglycerol---serine O-phosphatidyltransferase